MRSPRLFGTTQPAVSATINSTVSDPPSILCLRTTPLAATSRHQRPHHGVLLAELAPSSARKPERLLKEVSAASRRNGSVTRARNPRCMEPLAAAPPKTKNPSRNLWLAVLGLHLVLQTAQSVRTIIVVDSRDVTPIVLPMAVAGLVGVVIATLGAFIHRRAIVAGSRAILIGLILSMPSVLGTLALGYGLWTANLLFGEKTARLGYEIVSLRRAAMLSRTWSVWFAGALTLFGLGLLGLFTDNWYDWVFSWALAAFTAAIGVGVAIGRYLFRADTEVL